MESPDTGALDTNEELSTSPRISKITGDLLSPNTSVVMAGSNCTPRLAACTDNAVRQPV